MTRMIGVATVIVTELEHHAGIVVWWGTERS
jgi:hypothetical protein